MPEAKTKAKGRTRCRAPTNEGSVRAPICAREGRNTSSLDSTLDGATDNSADDLESSDAGNNISTSVGPNVALNGRPQFDAGLKESIKIHEAQSRNAKDADDATWI